MIQSIHSILKEYWGYENFRPLQEDIINSILNGKDTLAILPTGGGKSICFQVPALSKEGVCLVITPLIALMKDQVENLKKRGIPALSIVSGMTFPQIKKTLHQAAFGSCKFLYVSPERLETRLFKEYLPALPINCIAVDEAHCISQWGYDFRPSYLRIAAIREQKKSVPVLALTASATGEVQQDICEKLGFSDHNSYSSSFARPNLSYSIFEVDSKINKLFEILEKVPGTSIVYCKSRKRTQEIAGLLQLKNVSADFYHAGLSQEDRESKQEKWIQNGTRVMVCTNAFGMGIDKPDVRTVIHVDIPDCLESYYQEAGRAGRDGMKSYAVLLFQEYEKQDLKAISNTRYPSLESIRIVYQSLANYLQLPTGIGEDQYFEFELNDFTKKFALDVHLVIYSLQALQQEGVITYQEQIFQPSSARIIVDKNYLNEFEEAHPVHGELVKILLRSYGGIFEQDVFISEKQLAFALRKEKKQIIEGLQSLQQFGIIEYYQQKDTPQIKYLQNRVKVEDLYIDVNAYQKRKMAFEKRVESMVAYVEDEKLCRAVFIGKYFGDSKIESCSVCDNCLKAKRNQLSNLDFENIHNRLHAFLEKRTGTIQDVLQVIRNVEKEKVWEVIDFLVAEEKLTIDDSGRISLK